MYIDHGDRQKSGVASKDGWLAINLLGIVTALASEFNFQHWPDSPSIAIDVHDCQFVLFILFYLFTRNHSEALVLHYIPLVQDDVKLTLFNMSPFIPYRQRGSRGSQDTGLLAIMICLAYLWCGAVIHLNTTRGRHIHIICLLHHHQVKKVMQNYCKNNNNNNKKNTTLYLNNR